jgi:hypothetical protein
MPAAVPIDHGLHSVEREEWPGGESRNRSREDRCGSAEEPQKNHRKREGNLRQCDEEASDYGSTILLTMTPEAHDGHLD